MTSTRPSDEPALVDLSQEEDFTLGSAQVRPSIREVIVGAQTIRLQPRVMQVLVVLARARGAVVSRDALVANCWGGVTVGDDAINRCIGALRRLADETRGAFDIETLPRIGYRLIAPERPIEPVDANPYPSEPAPAEAIPAAPAKKRAAPRPWVIVAGLVAVLALGAVWLALGRPGALQAPEGVAVIPFDSPPGDAGALSMAGGVADVIAGSLAKEDIKSLPLKDDGGQSAERRNAAAIRRGASYVLGGRIQRDGDLFAVQVSLDEPRSGQILWSTSVSRTAAEAQLLQEEVAAKVAYVMRCAQDANVPGRPSIAVESLGLYLRTCAWMSSGSSSPEGLEMIRKVVQREPQFAKAWGLFAYFSDAMSVSITTDDRVRTLKEATDAAEHALRLDKRIGLAYAVLAEGLAHHDFLGRQRLFEKALAVDPNEAFVNLEESGLMSEVGRVADSAAYDQRVVDLDALQPYFRSELMTNLSITGQIGAAREVAADAQRLWPDRADLQLTRLGMEARIGDADLALRLLKDPKTNGGVTDAVAEDWRAFIEARRSHDPQKINAYAQLVLTRVASGNLDVDRAMVRLITIGDTNAAFELAAQNLGDLDTGALFRQSAEGKAMWRDPRFMPLAMRVGLVNFWTQSGKWPDFCNGPTRPYDCRAVAAALRSRPGPAPKA